MGQEEKLKPKRRNKLRFMKLKVTFSAGLASSSFANEIAGEMANMLFPFDPIPLFASDLSIRRDSRSSSVSASCRVG